MIGDPKKLMAGRIIGARHSDECDARRRELEASRAHLRALQSWQAVSWQEIQGASV